MHERRHRAALKRCCTVGGGVQPSPIHHMEKKGSTLDEATTAGVPACNRTLHATALHYGLHYKPACQK